MQNYIMSLLNTIPPKYLGVLVIALGFYAAASMWDFGMGYRVPRWAIPGRILFFMIVGTAMGMLIYDGVMH